MMVARDGVEPPTPAFSATLCCSLNNLSDFRWPPKYLRSCERHAKRGLKAWVQKQAQKAPQPRQNSAVSPSTTLKCGCSESIAKTRGKHGSGNGNHQNGCLCPDRRTAHAALCVHRRMSTGVVMC